MCLFVAGKDGSFQVGKSSGLLAGIKAKISANVGKRQATFRQSRTEVQHLVDPELSKTTTKESLPPPTKKTYKEALDQLKKADGPKMNEDGGFMKQLKNNMMRAKQGAMTRKTEHNGDDIQRLHAGPADKSLSKSTSAADLQNKKMPKLQAGKTFQNVSEEGTHERNKV